MDRSWMNEPNRLSTQFIKGVASFMEFARNSISDGKMACPCQRCVNMFQHTTNNITAHLLEHGFSPSYTTWYCHGETLYGSTPSNQWSNDEPDEPHEGEHHTSNQKNVHAFLGDMATGYAHMDTSEFSRDDEDLESSRQSESCNERAQRIHNILKETDEELFKGCDTHSKLSFILELYNKKCMHGWSNKSLDDLLRTLRETMPEGDQLPKSSYEVKKLIDELGLGYEKIDACVNNCMLFWKHNQNEVACLKCGESRYEEEAPTNGTTTIKKNKKNKKKKRPKKVLWWFPLKPRLQRLFMCSKTASLMRWHHVERVDDGYLRHPADASAWKQFDLRYADFAKDPRNIRLGLASDGFNPFRNLSSTHSTWPVMLTIYNWAPWLCMKQPSIILSLLIPGPQSPGSQIDVFLEPLIDELCDLWINGIETYDAHEKRNFQLHASLMWTINDFPAYGMLSGWRTKSKYACPHCGFNTWSKWLTKGGKFCYMGHRRFLCNDHPFRRNKRKFDGAEEHRESPAIVSGSDIVRQLNEEVTIVDVNGKVVGAEDALSKKSIFFKLPYWEFNLVRHNLDVMHIEKNVCDNILGTLLDVEGKSKDNLKSRLDLKEMGIRKDLHPIELPNGKIGLPPASYTMSRTEKECMLGILKSVQVPDGYSSNVSACVKMKERKLVGLKSHDCHVLMQDLLSIAIRGSLPDKVIKPIIEICTYFKGVCSKVLKVSYLEELETRIAETLCHMEAIFPPSFFTIMMHLVIHLATEARLAGPVQYRWMYPIERYLMTLKSSVKNRARPEGSIAEWYIANECITFCSRYFEGVETRFNRAIRNDDSDSLDEDLVPLQDAPFVILPGRPIGEVQDIVLDEKTLMQAHRYVLYNCDIIAPFRKEHRDVIRRESRNKDRRRASYQVEIEKLHNINFVEWLKSHVSRLSDMNDSRATDSVKWLARGPNSVARRFKGYITRGMRFRTKDMEESRKSQNSGVVVIFETSSSVDDVEYYGKINDIIELNYFERFRVVMFKCDWVDVERGKGVKRDKFGYTLVNFTKLIHTGGNIVDEPFVFASQVDQVFYIKDAIQVEWSVAIKVKPRDTFGMGDELSFSDNLEHRQQGESTEQMEEGDWVRNDVEWRTVAAAEVSTDDEES